MDEEEDAEILVGTYEDYVVGYRVECSAGGPRKKAKTNKQEKNGDGESNDASKDSRPESKQFSLEQSFAVRCHSGSVRCLATNANGTLALSAGFDEMINLFSLKKRKLLQTSEGAINCATYVGNSHLLCGSEDGNVYIYECKASSMALMKTLQGHKEAVTSVSAHPSGKILLSLSKDNTMRTWNLIKGRCAYVTNIRSHAHLVVWSKSGDQFLLAANNEIYLYNNSGNLEHSIKLEKRVNSMEFITENIFIVATDSGILEFFDLNKDVPLMRHEAHDARIKSVKWLGNNCFATASSDGLVKLWSADKPGVEAPLELARTDTGARLTCMTSTRV